MWVLIVLGVVLFCCILKHLVKRMILKKYAQGEQFARVNEDAFSLFDDKEYDIVCEFEEAIDEGVPRYRELLSSLQSIHGNVIDKSEVRKATAGLLIEMVDFLKRSYANKTNDIEAIVEFSVQITIASAQSGFAANMLSVLFKFTLGRDATEKQKSFATRLFFKTLVNVPNSMGIRIRGM